MDNITRFLQGVRQLGMKECQLFETTDLYSAKDMSSVVHTILSLAELFPKLNLNTEDESMLLTYDTEKPKMHNSKHRSTHDMSNEKQQTRKRSLTVNTTSEDPEEEKDVPSSPALSNHARPPKSPLRHNKTPNSTGSMKMKTAKEIYSQDQKTEEDRESIKSGNFIRRTHVPLRKGQFGAVYSLYEFNFRKKYAENGSLMSTLKAFGKFPEKLVASFCIKILKGLEYLHANDVVHCDLKAANILTTKTGDVKLTDFGVSLNLKIKTVDNDSVSGTPNWMAPEVIELKGATTKSDIWSLGCTLIELVTGKPPYNDLLPMSAMFRIVEDDYPPLPEDISENPEERSSSKELQKHEWILKNLKTKQKGNDSYTKNLTLNILIIFMSLESNESNVQHDKDEKHQTNKAIEVTTASELEQYYSSNTTAVMPIVDDNSSSDDNNSHKFIEGDLEKFCSLVCHKECKKDAFSCPPKVNDQQPSYDWVFLAKVYNTKSKRDKQYGSKSNNGTIKERGHHSSPSTLRNHPQGGTIRKDSRGYSQDNVLDSNSILVNTKTSDKKRLLKKGQDEQCIIS
ncbi:hypothetical protein RO3G_16165 [Rhizopus delemar RA 99-880]|uniref:Protein kinase domain-containing protein n=1 Tax=Rhizopus delemar (strain RA 99-880 / ATCC MYA-4621 / FGSC 9543 / NRRL 43880) TaxID=246409 RepID=I1CSM4_RHIO9|nr:hypothetical protein RO3G_16165 [Rhizopus delemar RA 99-880]|eukprot:EIE91454.1 hypothetical protein RO3G_16165 [Rhizopus delemar RA 99-880]